MSEGCCAHCAYLRATLSILDTVSLLVSLNPCSISRVGPGHGVRGGGGLAVLSGHQQEDGQPATAGLQTTARHLQHLHQHQHQQHQHHQQVGPVSVQQEFRLRHLCAAVRLWVSLASPRILSVLVILSRPSQVASAVTHMQSTISIISCSCSSTKISC